VLAATARKKHAKTARDGGRKVGKIARRGVDVGTIRACDFAYAVGP
jgi:hypothetical protein